jgi:hypothetical protein
LKEHNKKIFKSGLIASLITLLFVVYIFPLRQCHSTKWNDYKHFIWLFNDSVQNSVDTFVCVGEVRKSDELYTYNLFSSPEHKMFEPHYSIRIWKINALDNLDLHKVTFNKNWNFSDLKFNSGEELSSNSDYPIWVNFQLPFHNTLNVNLQSQSEIIKQLEGKNYVGFYGFTNKMSLSNDENSHLILFDSKEHTHKVLFLIYKRYGSCYLIDLFGNKDFDETIIKIFNLGS